MMLLVMVLQQSAFQSPAKIVRPLSQQSCQERALWQSLHCNLPREMMLLVMVLQQSAFQSLNKKFQVRNLHLFRSAQKQLTQQRLGDHWLQNGRQPVCVHCTDKYLFLD